ncbi:Proteasome activator complex subunit 4B [Armadillidium vulgare]|nr:Proteasome activator complex subunit 4B [Armadillidium vulgare]
MLTYQMVIIPDQEFWVTAKFAQILNLLLKKKELLAPDDLTLPWKPLMQVYITLFHSSYKNIGMIMLPQ